MIKNHSANIFHLLTLYIKHIFQHLTSKHCQYRKTLNVFFLSKKQNAQYRKEKLGLSCALRRFYSKKHEYEHEISNSHFNNCACITQKCNDHSLPNVASVRFGLIHPPLPASRLICNRPINIFLIWRFIT